MSNLNINDIKKSVETLKWIRHPEYTKKVYNPEIISALDCAITVLEETIENIEQAEKSIETEADNYSKLQ